MSDKLKPRDRVVHVADRHRSVWKPGTVEVVWTDSEKGIEYARVKWDDQPTPSSHPTVNLTRAT